MQIECIIKYWLFISGEAAGGRVPILVPDGGGQTALRGRLLRARRGAVGQVKDRAQRGVEDLGQDDAEQVICNLL